MLESPMYYSSGSSIHKLTIGNTLQCPDLNDTIFLSFSSFIFIFILRKQKKFKNSLLKIFDLAKLVKFCWKKMGFQVFLSIISQNSKNWPPKNHCSWVTRLLNKLMELDMWLNFTTCLTLSNLDESWKYGWKFTT